MDPKIRAELLAVHSQRERAIAEAGRGPTVRDVQAKFLPLLIDAFKSGKTRFKVDLGDKFPTIAFRRWVEKEFSGTQPVEVGDTYLWYSAELQPDTIAQPDELRVMHFNTTDTYSHDFSSTINPAPVDSAAVMFFSSNNNGLHH